MINREGVLVIRVPHRIRKALIMDFIKRIRPWIIKSLLKYRNSCPEYRFIGGEMLPFRGSSYCLKIISSEAMQYSVKMVGNNIEVEADLRCTSRERTEHIRQALRDWYLAQAGIIIPERFKHLAEHLDLRPNGLKLKQQTSRWGSCSDKSVIAINWQLVMAPPEVLDYVITHELCHIESKNHKVQFWARVSGFMPDYKVQRKWLRDNARSITFLTNRVN